MDIMGLLFLLLAQSTPSLAVSREYHLVNVLKTWTEAQSYCREKFADLATIETLEDQAQVKELVVSSGAVCVMIGLYDDVNSWRWSLDNMNLYQEGNTDLGSWFDFEVTNVGDREHCALLCNGRVFDQKCETLKRSVCYDESSNAYIPVAALKSWSAARSYCRETHTDLASVRSEQEMNDVLDVIGRSDEWWIGLSRDGWKWSDQSNSSLRLWYSGQPEGGQQTVACTMVAGWHDTFRHVKFPFICSAPVRKVMKVALKKGGSVDLNDPHVEEAFLKQMQKRMREQGIQQDFILRWGKQPDGNVFNKTAESLTVPGDMLCTDVF